MKQITLAANGFENHHKQSRKAEFLSRMDKLVPWKALCEVIEPVGEQHDLEQHGGRVG